MINEKLELTKELIGREDSLYKIDNLILDTLDLDNIYSIFNGNVYDSLDMGHTYYEGENYEYLNITFDIIKSNNEDTFNDVVVRIKNTEII